MFHADLQAVSATVISAFNADFKSRPKECGIDLNTYLGGLFVCIFHANLGDIAYYAANVAVKTTNKNPVQDGSFNFCLAPSHPTKFYFIRA